MKKLTLLLVLILVVAFTTTVFAQRLAILKPTNPGQTSEAIPITKKQLAKLMNSQAKSVTPIWESTHMGIIDTISHNPASSVNWGVAAGDTQISYYNPPAACYIKAVGIVGQSWGTEALSDGFNLELYKPAYDWNFPPELWDGDACYTKDSLGYPTLLGEKIWGEFPVTVNDGVRTWTDMIFLGYEPDTGGDPFIVSIVPYGGSYMGTDSWNYGSSGTDDTPRLAKYYQTGRGGHDPQFTVRHYSCSWLIVVEFYENTAPKITPGGPYGSVLNADAKTLECHIEDIDANDPAQAGVASAKLLYSVNGGDWTTVDMTLVSGTDTNGDWEGTIPAGYMNPGDILSFKFQATDKAGASSEVEGGSFGYFSKTTDLLVFYNDNTFTPGFVLPYYFYLVDVDYDVWDGVVDGPLSTELVNMYDYIVNIEGGGPVTLNDDVLGAWFGNGDKAMFWSAQEWAGSLWGWDRDSTFADDDWHNMYMGIGHVAHDINYTGSGTQNLPFPINAVPGDIISGPLADFCADSLQLYYHPAYELGFSNWIDQVDPGTGAVSCFVDSAEGRSVGVHKEYNGSKGVFLGFDQLALDTGPSYYWTEFQVHSVLGASLDWFGVLVGVEDNTNPGVALKYDLGQNYPNPFNPETKIAYSIEKAGLVKLAVYNVLGQKVADLVNEQKAAGTYHVTWNAQDLTSGVYFYRLDVGDYSKTMKMMLLR